MDARQHSARGSGKRAQRTGCSTLAQNGRVLAGEPLAKISQGAMLRTPTNGRSFCQLSSPYRQ
jgi:hypothetical protein